MGDSGQRLRLRLGAFAKVPEYFPLRRVGSCSPRLIVPNRQLYQSQDTERERERYDSAVESLLTFAYQKSDEWPGSLQIGAQSKAISSIYICLTILILLRSYILELDYHLLLHIHALRSPPASLCPAFKKYFLTRQRWNSTCSMQVGARHT